MCNLYSLLLCHNQLYQVIDSRKENTLFFIVLKNGWPVQGWPVHGWPVHDWPVQGWPVHSWPVHGWPVHGWPVHGWRANGWPVRPWKGLAITAPALVLTASRGVFTPLHNRWCLQQLTPEPQGGRGPLPPPPLAVLWEQLLREHCSRASDALKGLSHELDLAFEDMLGQSRPKQRRPVFK